MGSKNDFCKDDSYFTALVDASPDIITIVDPEMNILFANSTVKRMLGFDPDSLVGKKINDYIHSDDVPILIEALTRVVSGGKVKTIVLRVIHFGGNWRWLECHGILVIDAKGQRRLVVHASDITDHQESESALEMANKKLNILGSATRHDVLNSLTGLFGYLELAESKTSDEILLRYIRKARTASEVVRKQMEFTKLYQEIGSKRPDWINVYETIHGTLGSLPPNDVQINIEIAPIEIYADPMIEKAFYNLLENSLRHGERVKKVTVSNQLDEANMKLIFQDDGKGVNSEEKDLIFKRGYGKNTGYGLYMTKEVLGITGLSIVENGVPGKGARFEIMIPAGKYRRLG
ncbi:MAG: PAS domain-containing sensor histidine kinase [Methanomassiliicoccales archaeon]